MPRRAIDSRAKRRAIVDDQAARLAAAGSSLTEAVSRFVAARQPFLAELAGLGRSRSLDPTRLAALYGDASAILDRLLLRFIATHQRTEAAMPAATAAAVTARAAGSGPD